MTRGQAGNERSRWAFHAEGLLRNVAAGTRLALFLPLRASDFRVSALNYALLAVLSFAFWVGAAAARAGFEGEFDSATLTVYLATVTLVLATALLVALAYRAPERLLLIAVALTASDPAFELAGLALPALGAATGQAPAVYLVFIGWAWLIALRAAVVCGGWQRPQVYFGAAAVSAMTAIAFLVLPKAEVWLPPPAEEEPAEALVEERVFHLQGQLIERALAAIERGRPGVAELYFVGFAPDAGQDVFLREMRFVRRLFDERFATAGRSIGLASSQTALDELPIASITNLARAGARRRGDECRRGCAVPVSHRARRPGAPPVGLAAAAAARPAHADRARPDAAGRRDQVARDRGLGVLRRRLHRAAARRQQRRDHGRRARSDFVRLRGGPRFHLLRRSLLPRCDGEDALVYRGVRAGEGDCREKGGRREPHAFSSADVGRSRDWAAIESI